jgi:hypothetical protein
LEGLEIGAGFAMAASAKRKRRLWDAYAFSGFRPEGKVHGIFGDPKARIIRLSRRSKKHCAVVAVALTKVGTIARSVAYAIFRAPTRGYFSNSKCDAFFAGFVAK